METLGKNINFSWVVEGGSYGQEESHVTPNLAKKRKE